MLLVNFIIYFTLLFITVFVPLPIIKKLQLLSANNNLVVILILSGKNAFMSRLLVLIQDSVLTLTLNICFFFIFGFNMLFSNSTYNIKKKIKKSIYIIKILLKNSKYIMKNRVKNNTVLSIFKDYQEVLKLTKISENNNCSLLEDNLREIKKCTHQIERKYFFKEIIDKKNCFIDIKSYLGGKETEDWTKKLANMYIGLIKTWNFQYTLNHVIGKEGIKTITIEVQGEYSFGLLRTENGLHKLVRKSPFNNADKRQTTISSVYVYPEIKYQDNFHLKDLRIDTCKSSGAGGQHVNTTDSAVRITHIPSNISAKCQIHKSQHKNRRDCLKIIYSKYIDKKSKKCKKIIRSNNSFVRSYIMNPYKMVKDPRTNYQSKNTDDVLKGNIDDFIKVALLNELRE